MAADRSTQRTKADPAAVERAARAADKRDAHQANSVVVWWCFMVMAGVALADATFLIDGLVFLVGLGANFINYLFENSPWTDEEARSATKTVIYCAFVVAFGIGIYANRQNKPT
jgi:hypothetical protein